MAVMVGCIIAWSAFIPCRVPSPLRIPCVAAAAEDDSEAAGGDKKSDDAKAGDDTKKDDVSKGGDKAKSEGAAKGDEKKEKAKVAAEPEITVSPEGVSVHAVGVYAHTFFARLAEKTGFQVIVDDTIKERKVTVNLTNKTMTQIIDCIVSAYGLSSAEVNGIIMVSEGIPCKPSSYLLSDIAAIRTQYVPATEAKSLLPVFLQDHVKVNKEQNSVILSAPAEVLKKFREDIKQFDIPAAQILLEVLVVEFGQNAAKHLDFGLTWNVDERGVSSSASAGEIVLRGITDLPNEFMVQLRALVSKGLARVRAAPRVATLSGTQAEVFVGIQRYLRQPIEAEASPDEPDRYGGTVNFIDAGVRLRMTPWTGGGGEIIAEIAPEVSTLSALDPVTQLPEKSTRRAQTVVRVRDGQTVVIGGLLQRELHEVRTKVPVLGDIPLLGSLFRSRKLEETQTELVIFVTPHILSQTGHLSEEQEKVLRERFLEGGAKGAPPGAPAPAAPSSSAPSSAGDAGGNK